MERFEAGRPITVAMTKWGGRPHWHWAGTYLGADDEGDWLGYPAGTRYAKPGKAFDADWVSVGLVPRHDAAHLTVFNRPTATGDNPGPINAEIYVDMATPAVWEDTVLRSIDLDLDVVKRWDGAVEIIDQDEFEEHQLAYGYPPEIITMAEESAERVYDAMSSGLAPYAGSAERWFAILDSLA
ncbi:DUF402 domain-containing protein [Nocardioides sp. DS6]|uniref:DUF402 domain-containing protein n=1 Tax=Nocardioides eburneus TaxID=3231482 RepID=A0ABV3SYF3_9ACTN